MDKKDRDLIVKIGKRLGAIERELLIIKTEKKSSENNFIKKPIEQVNVMELDFYLQLGEQEVTKIHNALRESILQIMKQTGIKSMRCNISQE